MAVPATATVLGGWWNSQGVGSMVSISGANDTRRNALQGFGGRGGFGSVPRREIYDALLGAAPGALVQVSQSRVAASQELGGVRPVTTAFVINRVTTAADSAEFGEWLTRMSTFTSMPSPANLDRNPLGTR